MRSFSIMSLALVIIIAAFIGVSGFTFWYARGYSYLSDDPAACVNCHVMRDHFDSWSVSAHRDVTCNDCHVPHDTISKYLAKAEHGFWHSYAFTFQDVQVIRIKSTSLRDVQRNCVYCHERTVAFILPDRDRDAPERVCTRCHEGAGHVF
jgi:cytochrome c nitrite reductase small subunit